jgi:cob(I)alamin adenosyltransferase
VKIYTRGGDRGETSLFGGARVSKNDPRIEAYGTVDELSSIVGLARALRLPQNVDADLHQTQIDLFEIGARLASPGNDRFAGADPQRIAQLEQAIDAMESELAPLASFILPGGDAAAAQLHVARTVCRRAERCVVALGGEEATVAYLNRLSDYLFVAARYANLEAGVSDVPWKR